MKQAYRKRVGALEALAGEKVFGIQYVNADWHLDPVKRAGLVRIGGTAEVMTREAFTVADPARQLIQVVYAKDWRS